MASAQWQRANPAEHDYDDRLLVDGYKRVFVHPTIKNTCWRCGCRYHHYFVSHLDWAKVPMPLRSEQICIDCYVDTAL